MMKLRKRASAEKKPPGPGIRTRRLATVVQELLSVAADGESVVKVINSA
jgi:hypothetical protein